jgi:hypothetical protein
VTFASVFYSFFNDRLPLVVIFCSFVVYFLTCVSENFAMSYGTMLSVVLNSIRVRPLIGVVQLLLLLLWHVYCTVAFVTGFVMLFLAFCRTRLTILSFN